MEITDVDREIDTPLVVMELPAQRSEASATSVTMTIVSSLRRDFAAACNASSTTCCAGISALIVRTPRRC